MTITKTVHRLLIVSSLAALPLAQPVMAEQPAFKVTNGNELDADSYAGYSLYRNWCARCHGNYGQGLAAPNLAESLKKISKPEFMRIVAVGKTGNIGNMPGWKSNKAVMDGREKIYSYLKARADGLIGEVKPVMSP